jgi:hypothetical protein
MSNEYGFCRIPRDNGPRREPPRGPVGVNGPTSRISSSCDCGCEAKVLALEEKVKRLEQMVGAMWDAPGMPGANAIEKEYEKMKNE